MLTTGRDVQNYTVVRGTTGSNEPWPAVVFIEVLQHKQRIVTSYSSFENTNLLTCYLYSQTFAFYCYVDIILYRFVIVL
jgi:hypothetical protein